MNDGGRSLSVDYENDGHKRHDSGNAIAIDSANEMYRMVFNELVH